MNNLPKKTTQLAPETISIIAEIWSEILDVASVGIEHNFFELGGDSLLATTLASRLNQAFAVELTLRHIFETPTIVGLALAITQSQIEGTEDEDVAELLTELEELTDENDINQKIANLSAEKKALLELKLRNKNTHTSKSQAISPRENRDSYPLSFAQQRLWFLDRLESNSSFYNIPEAVRLIGDLKIQILQQALDAIVAHHKILRTNYTAENGKPLQVIKAPRSVELQIINLQHYEPAERENQVQTILQRESQRPFDLAADMMIRGCLLQLASEEQVLLIVMHHIASDGWSMGIFWQQLTTLYRAFLDGKPNPLPKLPIQYANYAVWQQEWLSGEVLDKKLTYWKQQLKDASPVLELPTDRPRPPVQTYCGASQSTVIPHSLSDGLKRLCRQQGVTLYMTLLAAFQTLLYRYSQQEDIIVGSPIAGRNRAELEGLIGFFVNTLVLRTDFSGNPSFQELLGRVRSTTLDAYSHQELPFDKLVAELNPERSSNYNPLFQVMFVFQNTPRQMGQFQGLTETPMSVETETAKFDLTLSMTEREGELISTWKYNTDLFDAATIKRMTAHFQTLLEGIVDSPQKLIAQLPLLTQAERQKLLRNEAKTEYFQDKCVHQMFEEQVKLRPDAVAVAFENQQLTYRELNERANQVADYLRQLGVRTERMVGLCVERSLDTVIGILGILKAGGAYVPLDPAYPKERIAYSISDSQVAVLLTHEKHLAKLPENQAKVVCFDRDGQAIANCSSENPQSKVEAANLAYVIYTSGSTGKPKGVLVTHQNVVRLFAATQDWYNFDCHDVWTLFHSYAFDFSVWEMWGALIYGGKLVVVPYLVSRSPKTFYQLLIQEKVTVLNQTPSAFLQLIQLAENVNLTGKLSLRYVIFGGEALQVQSLRPWFERHGDRYPQLVNMYGITETTVHVTYRPISMSDLEKSSSVIGRPIPDLQIYLLDNHLQPVFTGVAAEMYIAGAGLTRGYLNREELTKERFINNPFDKGNTQSKLYKSGDLARYLPDGELEYLGRIDNQVKIRGFRIELGEIEAALSQHSAVQQCVVLVREDEPGDKRIVAYVVVVSSAKELPTSVKLRQFLRQTLSDYMIPNVFIHLESLPLTPNGKVDRRALLAPVTSNIQLETNEEIVVPQTETEKIIAQIWCEILELERVSIEDNFFDLGGTSLLGLQLLARIQKDIGWEIRAVKLYQYPTIKKLAKYLIEAGNKQAKIARTQTISRSLLEESSDKNENAQGIAIVGMVGRFPGAANTDEFWRNLCQGVESSTFFTEEQIDPSVEPELLADPNYVRARGIIAGAELFDAEFFNISPREAEVTDPQSRIFLELAYEALENAGHTAESFAGKIGVYAGSGQNTYFENHLCGRTEIIDRLGAYQTRLANEKDFLTTRIAYKLNLTGPSISINTACSTSLVAIIQAFYVLKSHQCDMALAGGISLKTPQNRGYLYQEGGILSPDGHCRPFDANCGGTMSNNGAGIVVLKRLKDAQVDGDRIYAVIRGVGINNDGSDKVSFTAPSVNGQMDAILQAQLSAGINPETIDYIETHGTATPLGDPIEIEALTQAFGTQTEEKQFCAIGSVKSNVGHLVAAAGVTGVIKTALALHNQQIPPSLNFESPNPEIDLDDSPFYVNTKLADWKSKSHPRRAGVSSFGVGGTNAHIILEEAPPAESTTQSRPCQLLLLSAKTEAALEQKAEQLKTHLQQHPDLNLADVAYTLQQGRQAFNYRRFVTCQGRQEAIAALESSLPTQTASRYTQRRNPDVVFMFPGQGTQYVNMGANLYRDEPVFRSTVNCCLNILQPLLDRDLREIIYPSEPNDESATLLRQTVYTQPALFTIEYALAQLWLSWGIKPKAAIGHSIGEFVAACLAGVFSLEDALKLVAARGKMMWDLPSGAMLSVRLAADKLEPLLTPELAIAAINGPSLCVVSGTHQQVANLQETLEAQEIACKALHTSHAFHSPMMDAIVEPFAEIVSQVELSPPQMPFISTVTADWITDAQATDPMYWANHLRATVRFAEGIQKLWQQPERVLLEVGPRTTTTTLARQQATDFQKQIAISSLGRKTEGNSEWLAISQAIGQLWLSGVSIDWQSFYLNQKRSRLPLPTYPFARKRYWIDPLPARGKANLSNPRENTVGQIPTTAIENSINQPQPATTLMSESRKQRLLPIVKEVLESTSGLELSQIGNNITFLEIGLDSLSLTQVAIALKKKFKVKIAFRNLLEDYPNLDTLTEFLDRTLPPEAFPVPAAVANVAAQAVSTEAISTINVSRQSANGSNEKDSNNVRPQLIVNPGTSSGLEAVVAQQLQIMNQQLELLRQGGTTVNPPAAPQRSTTASDSNPAISVPPPQKTSESAKSAKMHGPGAKIQKSQDTTLTSEQQQALDSLIERYTARTQESKRQAQQHRSYLSDPRTVSGFSPLLKEIVYPIVTDRSAGSRLWDVDGNEYIDLTNGFGLNFFGWSPEFVNQAVIAQMDKGIEIGPQTPLAGKVAKMITEFTGMERVAFCNTGSEAVMAALRLARTVTGRNTVAIFKGSYHGTFDEVIVRSGANHKSLPAAPGIMASMFENILVLDYGTPESLEILRNQADDLAAIMVEPVQTRKPGLQPVEFLRDVRELTEKSETAFIFDEVVTGFRVHPGGAQAYFNIRADLATYGKVVGGGLPIGIVAGKAEYMDAIDGGMWQFGDNSIPEVGVTFFAGTFVRHPMALAAAEAVLLKLKAGGAELQQSLSLKVEKFVLHLRQHFERVGAPIKIDYFSSFFYVTCSPEVTYGGLLFYLLRSKGVHIWEYRPCFFTLAHTEEDIEQIIWAFKTSVAEMQSVGFLASSSNATAINRNLPPQPGARLGKDTAGNPAWFIPDTKRPGKFLQLDKQL